MRVVEQIRTIEKEQLPTIFVQQFTHKFQHKIENILNKQKDLDRQIYHCYTIAGATGCLIMLEPATMSLCCEILKYSQVYEPYRIIV